jgi:hypothetical protein
MINLNDFRKKVYSQFEEDGITEKIFELVGTTNKVCVEFGVEDGMQCCSRILWENNGFKQILFDNICENNEINLKKYTITVDNVIDIFDDNSVPLVPDFLSVDIDSYDFYILHRILEKYKPRVMVLETNPTFLKDNKVVKLDHPLNGGAYHGVSLKAWFDSLSDTYDLVCHEVNGINAFFVRKGLLDESVISDFNDFDKLHHQHQGVQNYRPYPSNYPILTSVEALELLNKL